MKSLAFLSAGLLLLTAAIVGWLMWGAAPLPQAPPAPLPQAPPAPLREVRPEATAVLETLDTPIPEGKSALWCASFQLAWERLKKDVTKGPVRLDAAGEAAGRLNEARSVAGTVNEADVYAAGGFVRDGVVAEIKREMARRFPEQAVSDLGELPGGAVAYAYLRAAAKFTNPFLESASPLGFVAADGSKRPVRSFGLPYGVSRHPSIQKQVEILHASRDEGYDMNSFVLDLCKDTSPYQVLVARIPRGRTLAAMLADMEKRIAGPNDEELMRPLRLLDSMEVPHLRFRVAHHFKELEGKRMPDQGMVLERAFQQIDFRLDAAGAILTSISVILPKADPRGFRADHPFLVLMRKRGTTQPFFVLWVENSELLEPWGDE